MPRPQISRGRLGSNYATTLYLGVGGCSSDNGRAGVGILLCLGYYYFIFRGVELEVFLLALSSCITSVVAGFTGMAGGVMMLALMTMIVPQPIIVPLHAVVQIFSNGFRTFTLRRSIHRRTMKFFIGGAAIGGCIGYLLIREISSSEWFLVVVCILLLYIVFKPQRMPDIKLNAAGFFLLGIFTAAIGPLIGTVGPFLAPFFVRGDFSKETIVATKGAAQATVHVVKIPIFLSLQFAYQDYVPHMAGMIIAAYIGTWIGVKLLYSVDQKLFMRVVKVTMLLIAVRLIYKLVSG